MNIQLIKGTELTEEQKKMLNFFGMKDPKWIDCHSFYFVAGKPSQIEGYFYPVCHSNNWLWN